MQKTTGYVPAEGPRSKDTTEAKKAFKDADVIVIPAGVPSMYSPTFFSYLRSQRLTLTHREARHDP